MIVARAEDFGADHPSVVVPPPCYDGIEFADDLPLAERFAVPSVSPDFPGMSFDGLLAWAYEGLKSKWSSVCVLSRVGFAHAVLLHMKAQEFKAHVSLTRVKRVGCACFLDSSAGPCALTMSLLFLLPFVVLLCQSRESRSHRHSV